MTDQNDLHKQLISLLNDTEHAQYTETKPNGKVLFVAPPYVAEAIAKQIVKDWEVGSKGDYNGMPSWVARPRALLAAQQVPPTAEEFQNKVQERAMKLLEDGKAPSLFDATNAARNALEMLMVKGIKGDANISTAEFMAILDAIAGAYAATTSSINVGSKQ